MVASFRRAPFPFANLNIEVDRNRLTHLLDGQKGKLFDVIRRATTADDHLVSFSLDLEPVDPSPSTLDDSALKILFEFGPRQWLLMGIRAGHHCCLDSQKHCRDTQTRREVLTPAPIHSRSQSQVKSYPSEHTPKRVVASAEQRETHSEFAATASSSAVGAFDSARRW